MFRIIVFSLFILFYALGGCQKPNQNGSDDTLTEDPANQDSLKFTYLALGDSYTIGEGVEEPHRYPNLLRDSLADRRLYLSTVDIVARTGWTTGDLKAGIESADIDEDYDMVSLLIGVNNQFRGLSIDNYRNELTDLLERAIAFADDQPDNVFVLSIPDYGVTPFGIRRDGTDKTSSEIDAFNAVKREVCDEYGIRYFNITDISREAKDDISLLVSDELHPSGKMYAKWVSLMVTDIESLLKE